MNKKTKKWIHYCLADKKKQAPMFNLMNFSWFTDMNSILQLLTE
jgi:hypothetical protein